MNLGVMGELRIRAVHTQQQHHPAATGFDAIELAIRISAAIIRLDQIAISVNHVAVGNDRVGGKGLPAGESHPCRSGIFYNHTADAAVTPDDNTELAGNLLKRLCDAVHPTARVPAPEVLLRIGNLPRESPARENGLAPL